MISYKNQLRPLQQISGNQLFLNTKDSSVLCAATISLSHNTGVCTCRQSRYCVQCVAASNAALQDGRRSDRASQTGGSSGSGIAGAFSRVVDCAGGVDTTNHPSQCCRLRFALQIDKLRNRNCSQYAQNHNDHHQLDQCKTRLFFHIHIPLRFKCVRPQPQLITTCANFASQHKTGQHLVGMFCIHANSAIKFHLPQGVDLFNGLSSDVITTISGSTLRHACCR